MFTEEVLKHLSYACGCPLDIRHSIGIVNGVCKEHPKNVLLFDGVPLSLYKIALERKARKLDQKKQSAV